MNSEERTVIEAKLKAPFAADEVEWRVQSSGVKNGRPWLRVLTYVSNRAIQNRLDEVFGVDGWQNEFKIGTNGMLCGIGVRFPGSEAYVWRWDGAEITDVEPFKGGLSSAMKRAAVHFGIGRYLYYLEASFAVVNEDGRYSDGVKDGEQKRWVRWDPPALPAWALPGGSGFPGREPEPKPAKGATAPKGKAASEHENIGRPADTPPAAAPAGAPPATSGGGKKPAPAAAGFSYAAISKGLADRIARGDQKVVASDMEEALEQSKRIGLTTGQFKQTFAMLVNRVNERGMVDYEKMTLHEFAYVWQSFENIDAWNYEIAHVGDAKPADESAGEAMLDMMEGEQGGIV